MPPRLGPFEVVRPLGEGGAGAVFEVRRAGDPRRLALKVLRVDPGSDANRRERFRREGELLARLRHAAIVPVHEAGELPDGAPYLLLELVEGETLRALIEREAPLDPERATRLVLDVARGLAHAHGHGVVHRDVKPENVLVDARGARITDFGLALAPDHERLTASRVVVGTLAYLAPEQVRTHTNALGPWTDVHALGLLLHEACSGERAFPGVEAPVLAAQVLNLRASPLREVAPRASVGLEAVVARCLEKAPEARYADAGALAADLERVLEGRAPLAGRRGALGALALLPVLAPLVLLALGLWLLRRDDAPAAPGPAVTTAPPTSAGAPAGPAPAWRLAAGERLQVELGWWEAIERFGATSATKPFLEMTDTAALAQRLELKVVAAAPERLTLEARVVALRATYTAAGAAPLAWASSPSAPATPTGPPRPGNPTDATHAAGGAARTDDPLAPLALLLDRPFTLALDPRTGSILALDGWQATWSAFAVRAGVSGPVVEWDWGHPPDHEAQAYVAPLSPGAVRRALDLLWDVAPPGSEATWTRSLTLPQTTQFERPGGLLVEAAFRQTVTTDGPRVAWSDDGGAPRWAPLGHRAVPAGVRVLRYALRGEADLRVGRVARAEAEQRVETSDGERVTTRWSCRDVTP